MRQVMDKELTVREVRTAFVNAQEEDLFAVKKKEVSTAELDQSWTAPVPSPQSPCTAFHFLDRSCADAAHSAP